jgi:hypothetical protein
MLLHKLTQEMLIASDRLSQGQMLAEMHLDKDSKERK